MNVLCRRTFDVTVAKSNVQLTENVVVVGAVAREREHVGMVCRGEDERVLLVRHLQRTPHRVIKRHRVVQGLLREVPVVRQVDPAA
jgi:hypothetical protein